MKKIRILTTHAMGNLWLMEVLDDFTKSSDVALEIELDDETIRHGDNPYDLIITSCDWDDPGLEKNFVTEFEMGLYASEIYVKTHGEPKSAAELAHHKVIAFTEKTPWPEANINWHLQLAPNLEPILWINSGHALLQAIENGVGIGSISQGGDRASKIPLRHILPHLKHVVEVYIYTPVSKDPHLYALKKILIQSLNRIGLER